MCKTSHPLQIFTCDQLLTYLRSFTAVKEEVKEGVKQVEAPAGLKPFKRQELVDEMFTGVPKKAPVQKGKVGRVPAVQVLSPLTLDERAAALAYASSAGVDLRWRSAVTLSHSVLLTHPSGSCMAHSATLPVGGNGFPLHNTACAHAGYDPFALLVSWCCP